MTPDTWGIPGPTFLVLFLAAVVVVATAAAVHRRSLFAGDSRLDVERLTPERIAYLNGRERLAVYTAMGGLRAAEAIGSGDGRTLRQTGALPAGASALDGAVYHAAGRRIRAREIGSDMWVVSALGDLRADLERTGLATTAEQRRTARLWALPAGALVLLGIARLVAGSANGHPVGLLIPSVAAAVAVVVAALVAGSSVRTRAAIRGLDKLRKDHRYLSPRQSPAYATYGAGGAALGVALFGASSLYAMDPGFAAEAGIRKAEALGGTDGWIGGGSSCAGASGGGGGCGGGDGGCGG